jgi:serine/threonine-protein kinase RsbW
LPAAVTLPVLRRAYSVPDLLPSVTKALLGGSDGGDALQVEIASDPAETRRVQEEIEQRLKAHHFAEKEIFSIKLALEEAMVNAIKHGNQFDRGKKVHVACRVAADRFEVVIADEGPGFNPADVPDPVAFENLERPCGRGLLLMRHYMTEVSFHPPGNTVHMVMVRTPPPISARRNGHPKG